MYTGSQQAWVTEGVELETAGNGIQYHHHTVWVVVVGILLQWCLGSRELGWGSWMEQMGGMVLLRNTGGPEERDTGVAEVRGTGVPEGVSNGCHAVSWNKEGEPQMILLYIRK